MPQTRFALPGPAAIWLCLLVVAVVVALAELTARAVLADPQRAATVVDIQTADTLCLKLDQLRRFDGRKVVILGDSLALGEAMRNHGNANWRNEELAHALREPLQGTTPTLIMNLGMNGGLPADQARILDMVRDVPLDLAIAFVSVRSFSTDFAKPADMFSRRWLAEIKPDSELGCIKRSPAPTWDVSLRQWLSEHLALVRGADLLQRIAFDNTLRGAIETWRKAWGTPRPPQNKPETVAQTSPEVLLLARRRYLSIDFNRPHAQVSAFEAMRDALPAQARQTIFVYGNEASRQLPSLLGRQNYLRHRQTLSAMVRPGCRVAYLDDLRMPPERFIDYVHVDAEGYRIMARAIAERVSRDKADCPA
jgi:lysophospholipase L1-like esterase